MKKKYSFIIICVILFVIICLTFFPVFGVKKITMINPLDGSVFPSDMYSTAFLWDDKSSGADNWKISFKFQDSGKKLEFKTVKSEWIPEPSVWKTIKESSFEKDASVEITGYKKFLVFMKKKSVQKFVFKTSKDNVEAPIFFRIVPLPFDYAVKHMDMIKWCLGDVSTGEKPKIVLENMPVCGNCHSFTADGKTMGMDVDYANDKGSYIITSVSEEMKLTKNDVISWSEYKREDKELTFGLLSSLSPDGKYAISTVKDRSVFVPRDDLYFSQLFFPLKGILVYYDRQKKTFQALPGADDKKYVQSNPTWSPDGKNIIFSRSLADTLRKYGSKVVLPKELCDDYLSRQKLFKFDLYKIPFNDGKGGEAVPINGASNNGNSNYFARYSPDGKWIVFCQASSFMLLQPDSKLFIMPAEGGSPREMKCNSSKMNSWHSWSPNSKWIVFSSKANTPYTQLFLTHIDENGNDSVPVLIANFVFPEKAANIPEFVNIKPGGIKEIKESFVDDYSYVRSGYYFEDYFEDYENAEKEYKKAITLNSKSVEAHQKLAKLYYKQKALDKAADEYKESLKLDPKDTYSKTQLGIIYKEQNKFDLAEKELTEVLKIEPKNYYALHHLGYLYLGNNKPDQAEKVFLTLLKTVKERQSKETDAITSPTKRDFVVRANANLGNLYLTKKDYEKAEFYFKTVTEIDPDNYLGHVSLGKAYYKAGKPEPAIKELETALSLNPNVPGLKEELEQMKRVLGKS
jgi:Tfp pilus assembly protein PilF